jgi:hypothetical protein
VRTCLMLGPLTKRGVYAIVFDRPRQGGAPQVVKEQT